MTGKGVKKKQPNKMTSMILNSKTLLVVALLICAARADEPKATSQPNIATAYQEALDLEESGSKNQALLDDLFRILETPPGFIFQAQKEKEDLLAHPTDPQAGPPFLIRK